MILLQQQDTSKGLWKYTHKLLENFKEVHCIYL